MADSVVVFDSAPLGSLVTDGKLRQALLGLTAKGWRVIIPTVVLAEATTERPEDATVNQTVKRLGTVGTDERVARLAGGMRFRAMSWRPQSPLPSGIDAIVAAHAVGAERAVVFTGDPGDFELLLSDRRNVVIKAV